MQRSILGSALGAVLVLLCACSSESADTDGKGGSATSGAGGTSGGTATGGSSGGGGSGGASGGGTAGVSNDGSTGRPPDLPNSDSQADIGAFLESGGYKRAPWISESNEPRAGTVGTQHAGKVRVWENPPLVASLKGGRDGRMSRPFPDQWSMAVKELYDEMTGQPLFVPWAGAEGHAGLRQRVRVSRQPMRLLPRFFDLHGSTVSR
jgi:hypothetical protein